MLSFMSRMRTPLFAGPELRSGPADYDMTMPPALRRWGLCVACLSLCPDPAGIAHRDRHYFAYVIPVGQAQEIAPAVGTS